MESAEVKSLSNEGDLPEERKRSQLLTDAFCTLIHQLHLTWGLSPKGKETFPLLFHTAEVLHSLAVCFSCRFSLDTEERNRFYEALSSMRASCIRAAESLELPNQEARMIASLLSDLVLSTVKTTYFVARSHREQTISFRIDPRIIWRYFSPEFCPQEPFAIFFLFSPDWIGFHIRFRDLARGGLRTVYIADDDKRAREEESVFLECYSLAYTQEKKNKDIAEGGSKGVIFARSRLLPDEEEEALFSYQKQYIRELISLVNIDERTSTLVDRSVIDYYLQPEYLYLGPDERMKEYAIEWISQYAIDKHYRPGHVFMSSKPGAGINHKVYGVTSEGIVVWMYEAMKRMFNTDCATDPFSISMTGGPDGDVASNTIKIVARDFPHTGRFHAIKDKSGIAYDPKGLNMKELLRLAQEGRPIAAFSPKQLSGSGWLIAVDEESGLLQQYGRKKMEALSQEIMRERYERFLFHVTSNIFIPAGGRPRTLTSQTAPWCLNEQGETVFHLVVEGANLFFSQGARRLLEEKGVVIVKDSSANKGGVISSSYEMLVGLLLSQDEFLEHKERIASEIIARIKEICRSEAELLFRTEEGLSEDSFLTERSMAISDRIHDLLSIARQGLSSWDPRQSFHLEESDVYTKCLLAYCLPILREKYARRVCFDLPLAHQRACVAAFISSFFVYRYGLHASYTMDMLPHVAQCLLLPSTSENSALKLQEC